MKTITITIRGTIDTERGEKPAPLSERAKRSEEATANVLKGSSEEARRLLVALSSGGVELEEATVTVADRVTPGSHVPANERKADLLTAELPAPNSLPGPHFPAEAPKKAIAETEGS